MYTVTPLMQRNPPANVKAPRCYRRWEMLKLKLEAKLTLRVIGEAAATPKLATGKKQRTFHLESHCFSCGWR